MAFRPIPHQPPPIDDDARERTTRGALTLVPPGSPGAAEAFAAASARMLAPMFGRDALVAEVESLLQGETARIVTLTGPGGVGKTRLAVALAERLRPAFPDGVAFIPLASVRDPHHVIPAIAAALGLSESPTRTIGDEMHRWLRGKEVLLVLDNLEQVLACGPALAALLADSPGLTILATSRAPLAISGEQRVVVPPLAVPAPGEVEPAAIRTHPAVQLFEDRARRTDPHFAITPRNADAVAAICSRLDGLPLALELAAARTAILSPAALLARLSDRFRVLAAGTRGVPERHRTLRQAIAWTYDLLPDDAQWMVRMLSVFEDGWSLELVEALERSASWACGPSPAVGAIDLLHELVDQSLVQVRMRPEDGEPRFRMLETVRAFGQEQAFVLGEDDALRAAHLEAVLAVARSHALDLDSPDRDAVFRRLDPEWENIRAAHAWALCHGRPAQALRLANAVWHACEVKGTFALGRAWHESALAALADDPLAAAYPDDVPLDASEWLAARLTTAFLREDCMDGDGAEPLFREVHAEAMARDDPFHRRIAVLATLGLGLVTQGRAEPDAAKTWFDAAAASARDAGLDRLEAIAVNFLGRIAYLRMDLEDAGAVFTRAREIAARSGDRRLEARYLNNLAVIALERDDPDTAERLLDAAVETGPWTDDPAFAAKILTNRGKISRARGNLAAAESEVRAALALAESLETPGMVAFLLLDLAAVMLDRGPEGAEPALAAIRAALDRNRDLDDPALLAMALLAIPRLAVLEARWAIAAETFDLADRVRTRIGMAWTPKERRMREPERVRIAASLPRGQTPASVFDPALLAANGSLDLRAVQARVDALLTLLAAPVEPAPAGAERRILGLTARETEVLIHLGRGASTHEIAAALSMSPRTATTHISRILAKLGVSSRAAAVAFAARNGFV